MANPEHLTILRQGVKVWNRWREEHPGISIDLSNASLNEANLQNINLRDAYLQKVDLSNANLSGADLRKADLGWAHLGGANLREADLTAATLIETNFHLADLTNVVLARANLTSTNLSSAGLIGADLTEASLAYTIFGDTDLTAAKALETCYHYGSSVIDYQTLAKSGALPLPFLRGCGLPDSLIDYLPSLLTKPTPFYSCFISYSVQDEDFARKIHTDLQTAGVRSWFAPANLRVGDRFQSSIHEAIRANDKLLLVLSEHAMVSEWVKAEVEMALAKEQEHRRTVLFPIRLDDAVMESHTGWASAIVQSRQILDFTHWQDQGSYQRALSRLLRDLTLTVSSESQEKGQW